MKIYLISIFPEIFKSFFETSLIAKAIDKKLLKFEIINPRDFCQDKHKKVDDEIYGGGAGLLMKAKPFIDAVNLAIKRSRSSKFNILFMSPSKQIRNQKMAHSISTNQTLVLVAGRYEGIDYRFEQYMNRQYKTRFKKISIWQFITLWWELPAMTIIESIVRLLPWVIKEADSRKDESYSVWQSMENLEYPQYTRPEELLWLKVPDVLLNWNHSKIQEWKTQNSKSIK